ncbi:MAG: LamB/YcsF family protein [Anaerolineae bacterium]|nr:LamB/YcsF family protein [Anaerolineae bacterium]
MRVDINCDMGEGFGRYTLGRDSELIPLVSSVNIACGMHAGDPLVMEKTVRLAAAFGVRVGAHPGYPDLQGFGRRAMDLTPEEVEAFVLYQVSALAGFACAAGISLTHVKPHGALYNQAAQDVVLARAVARAVARFDTGLILVGLAGSALIEAGVEQGLQVANEGFPERGYNPDGTLMSRRQPGSVIDDPLRAAAQALNLVQNGIEMMTREGERCRVGIDTLCIHGDSPNALAVASAVRAALLDNHITIGV